MFTEYIYFITFSYFCWKNVNVAENDVIVLTKTQYLNICYVFLQLLLLKNIPFFSKNKWIIDISCGYCLTDTHKTRHTSNEIAAKCLNWRRALNNNLIHVCKDRRYNVSNSYEVCLILHLNEKSIHLFSFCWFKDVDLRIKQNI